jgi:hypothetical protein
MKHVSIVEERTEHEICVIYWKGVLSTQHVFLWEEQIDHEHV